LLKEIPILFKDKGYNPITKKYMKCVELSKPQGELHPDLNIIDAFNLAKEKLKGSDKHKKEIRIAINRFEKGSRELRMTEIKIKDFKRSELKTILEYLNLPDNYFNKFRAYLSCLFNELVEYDCCEINLTRDIRKRKITKKVRETLEIKHLKQIAVYLKEKQPAFYRYMMIFFYSGARSSELLRLKKSEVDLENQEYKITIQKGRQYNETIKVIVPNALPFWKEVMQEAKAGDYLFAKSLKPDPVPIAPQQITRRWRYHVKSKLVIKNGKVIEKSGLDKNETGIPVTADFYSLKHLFLDKVDEATSGSSENISSNLASHTTPTITNSVYLVNKKKREREQLKKLQISL
jgi:integrase